jgi:glycosyltransferase involved in cell wall biosynthesis
MPDGSTGRYSLFDVDVTHLPGDLPLSPGDAGAAVLIRRKGVPIGFWMQEATGSRCVSAGEVAKRIGGHAGEKIVAEAIREEMSSPSAALALPLVTVAICTRDRSEGVERLLRSLSDQASALPDGSAGLEILVVDNAPSNERTRELAARRPEVRYLREPRPGLNFARNLALQEARGEILVFLDDDVVVDRHWSAGFASAWAENRDAVAFTGQVLPLELETDAQVLFEFRAGFRRGFDRIRYGAVLPGDRLYPGGAGVFGTGANMAFRTDVVRHLGGFDDALDTGAALPGGGDLDMFYRIIRAGHALIYEPRFLVFHQHRREMKALRFQYRRSWGFGFMCYVSKCMRTDPERRVNLRRLIVWWFVNGLTEMVMHLRKRLRGERHVPPSIFIGQLYGGVVGLLGGYARSQRRVETIRRRFAR